MTDTNLTDMPYLFVSIIHHEILLLVSPLITNFVSLRTGKVLTSLVHTTSDASPRCASSTLIDSSSSEHGSRQFSCLLALAFDHKELSVYKLHFTSDSNIQQLSIIKIWSENLPKRVTKIEFENDSSIIEKRIIVGDRHGDVCSYVVPLTEQIQQPNGSPVNKKQRIDESAKDGEKEVEAGSLHVGHVSYLSDFVLSSFIPSKDSSIPSFIITADRDEHIRISRWGSRRAGYIALRYLLGSTQAIGSLCTVEGNAWQSVRMSNKINEIGMDRCSFPFLISADNSTIRLWSLHPDSKAEERQDCLAVFALEQFLSPFALVDVKKERRRDQMFGKGRVKVPRQADGAPILEEGENHVALLTPIITKLRTFFNSQGEVCLTFTIEGGKALFSIPLHSFISSENVDELIKSIKVLDCTLPILEYAIHENKEDGIIDAWVTADVRRDFSKDEIVSKQPIKLARWDETASQFNFVGESQHPILQTQSNTLALKANWDDASSMILYDALTMFNRRDVEYSDTIDVMSKDGLIKGGFPNHEISNNKNSKNQQSEGLSRKREMAREEMKRRIESRIQT